MDKKSSFPRVTELLQLNKTTEKTKQIDEYLKTFGFSHKEHLQLKSLLSRKEIVINGNEVLMSIRNCYNSEKNLDKVRIINLVRACCKFNTSVSISGWNNLMIHLGLTYGGVACLKKVKEIRDFILKHGEAYLTETNTEAIFEIVKASEQILKLDYDYLLAKHPTEETSSFKSLWVNYNDVCYVNDELMSALLNYGYTKEQLKGIFHRITITKNYDLIPFYLRKKYLVNPDGTKMVSTILFGKDSDD